METTDQNEMCRRTDVPRPPGTGGDGGKNEYSKGKKKKLWVEAELCVCAHECVCLKA